MEKDVKNQNPYIKYKNHLNNDVLKLFFNYKKYGETLIIFEVNNNEYYKNFARS